MEVIMEKKMKKIRNILIVSILMYVNAAFAEVTINGIIGSRDMQHKYWQSINDQTTLGAFVDYSLGQLPLYATAGIQISAATDSDACGDFTVAIADMSGGIKVMPRSGVVRPYLGIGLANVAVSGNYQSRCFAITTEDTDDRSFGTYINAGIIFRIGKSFNVGLDIHQTDNTDITLFKARKVDANSRVGSLLFGFEI